MFNFQRCKPFFDGAATMFFTFFIRSGFVPGNDQRRNPFMDFGGEADGLDRVSKKNPDGLGRVSKKKSICVYFQDQGAIFMFLEVLIAIFNVS
jgi:hypothetical protein